MKKMQVLQENPNIPAFLGKLWKMVNDPSTDHLISWSRGGNTFIIQNQAQFWYELLPLYYKHNNMSSFVRQLNMYGFHKISILENSSTAVGTEKDDMNAIQFYHPYFQKDKPEKLKNIKRKGASSKPHEMQGVIRSDDLSKVLTDVKQLRGRQSSVDSQLSAMKQENAVLWRELAILRQKHVKQQQIVNKLIQFLVTLVQPTASPRMGVGVKRRMPLMLHENPTKKNRTKKNGRPHSDSGPTIHELDPEVDLSPEKLLEEAAVIEEDIPLEAAIGNMEKTNKIDSPITPNSQVPQESSTSQQVASPVSTNQNVQNDTTAIQQQPSRTDSTFWDKPEFVFIEDANDYVSDNEEELINTLQKNAEGTEKVFLNPNNRDTLIGSLINSGNYNLNGLGGKNMENVKKQPSTKEAATVSSQPSMQIATKNHKIVSGEDLDLHLDSTQQELDQLKDILNGCNSFDANSLLGLFADNDPDYGIRNTLQNKENPEENADPLVSGNEVAPANNIIDFNELFGDDLNNQDGTLVVEPATLNTTNVAPPQSSSLDTPVNIKNEPTFSL